MKATNRGDGSATSNNWWSNYQSSLSSGMIQLIELEDQAQSVDIFCSAGFPALLQTEDTMKAMVGNCYWYKMSPEDKKLLIKVNLERQWQFLEGNEPPKLQLVLDEVGLLRRFSNNEHYHQQLQHILQITQEPHISIGILPKERGDLWCMHHNANFFLYNTPDGSALHLEVYNVDMAKIVEDTLTIDIHRSMFRYLKTQSLSQKDSRKLIEDLAKRVRQQEKIDW